MSGRVQLTFSSYLYDKPLTKSGELRILAQPKTIVRKWGKQSTTWPWPKTLVLRVLLHVNVLLDGRTDMILALLHIQYFGSTVNAPVRICLLKTVLTSEPLL
jgi:hypothetical protein